MKLFQGLLAGLATAFFVAWGLPAIVISLDSQYYFDFQSYLQVFVHRHHDVLSWFQRGWPDGIIPVCVIFAPLLGGLILHFTWFRERRAPDTERPDIVREAVLFALFYSFAAILAAAIAEFSHPYPFSGWSEFFQLQGALQLGTLFILAVVMSAVGAYGALWFHEHRHEPL